MWRLRGTCCWMQVTAERKAATAGSQPSVRGPLWIVTTDRGSTCSWANDVGSESKDVMGLSDERRGGNHNACAGNSMYLRGGKSQCWERG